MPCAMGLALKPKGRRLLTKAPLGAELALMTSKVWPAADGKPPMRLLLSVPPKVRLPTTDSTSY